MPRVPRRQAVLGLGAALTALATQRPAKLLADDPASGPLRIAPFRFDVTPPLGHGCCGGWIKPVVGVDDAAEALGFVLLGGGQPPVVVCAVDWTGILNGGHILWRTKLAEAAGTTPDRVAVQCVHQHNAPMACLDAQQIVAAQGDLPAICDPVFFRDCVARGQQAIVAALPRARPVTHIGHGQAQVREVASNRRFVGPDGRIQFWRGSATRDEKLRELPEGLIDPWLKTVAFYEGDQKLLACHYYATHPMSYYGDGRVTSEFVGLARKQRQAEEPETTQIYFTGCAGNVAAGKYNEGTPESRVRLTRRIHEALVAAGQQLQRQQVTTFQWKTQPLLLAPNPAFTEAQLQEQIGNRSLAVAGRNRPAFTLAFLRRCQQQIPLVLSALDIGDASLLHLPAESFIEYQLRAQQLAPQRFVAVAAYGDGGPWYIPTKEAYPQGGYEVSVAFSSDATEATLEAGLRQV
ncbi:MAG: hypothetical protein U0935_02915 [Pirellulales bacterium]